MKRLLSIVLLSVSLAPLSAWADAVSDFKAADAAMDQGDYDGVIRYTTSALQQSGLDVQGQALAHNDRGLAYAAKGANDKAIADYTEALRLHPDYTHAYDNRALAYDYAGQYDKAVADFTQVLRLQADDNLSYDFRGMSYLHALRFDLALADFTADLRLAPYDFVAFNGRGQAYLLKGEFQNAVAEFNHALEQNAGDQTSLIWRYLAEARLGTDAKPPLLGAAGKLHHKHWPYPVIAYYLGDLTREQLLAAAKDADAQLQASRECDAAVYLAEDDLLRHHPASAMKSFQQAKDSCPKFNSQETLARVELQRL
jgi:lipoprotein NlpI